VELVGAVVIKAGEGRTGIKATARELDGQPSAWVRPYDPGGDRRQKS